MLKTRSKSLEEQLVRVTRSEPLRRPCTFVIPHQALNFPPCLKELAETYRSASNVCFLITFAIVERLVCQRSVFLCTLGL